MLDVDASRVRARQVAHELLVAWRRREWVAPQDLGLAGPAQGRFIQAAFALLDMISFLTMGPDECRAWPIVSGLGAQRAAGKVHDDIERGFIRAEVIAWDDYIANDCSEQACKQAGKTRLEGKTYVVQDGDIVNFRFNV